MKKWRRYLPIGILVLVVAAAVILTVPVKAQTDDNSVIPQRVYFGNISGGGLTREEASKEIEAYVEKLKDTKITLAAGKNTVETTAGALGLTWNNPEIVEEAAALGKSGNLIVRYKQMKDLEHEDKVYTIGYAVDAMKVAGILENNLQLLNTEAVDAGLKREEGKFVIIPGSQGVTVNVEDSVAAIEEYFLTDWQENAAQVELTAEVVEPRGTEEELSKVTDLLGGFTTNFADSSAGRVKNVNTGAERINGSVVYPGDQFSVYEAVSPFTPENGYELAGAYENGQTVESYGGGICQVSTTLYNAVIRAELEVVERFAHSMIVTYVDPSADAAIAGTYKDLKFVNNTDAPIYIEGYTSGRNLSFNIFGQETRDANREVSFYSETTSSSDPGIKFEAVEAPIGTITKTQGMHPGVSAKLWKIVTVNGEEVSREIFNTSTYRASPAVYEVGVASANPEAVNAMNAAIATQDEATIQAAAAAWNDAALAAAAEQQRLEEEAKKEEEAQKEEDKEEPEKPGKPEKPEKPGKDEGDKNNNDEEGSNAADEETDKNDSEEDAKGEKNS